MYSNICKRISRTLHFKYPNQQGKARLQCIFGVIGDYPFFTISLFVDGHIHNCYHALAANSNFQQYG